MIDCYGRYGRGGPPQPPSPVQNVADLASLLELKVGMTSCINHSVVDRDPVGSSKNERADK